MANSSFFAPADDSSEAARLELAAAVRNAQIVVGAITAGTLTFLVVALVARREGLVPQPGPQATPLITYTALALGSSTIVALAFAPGWIVAAGRRKIAQQLAETERAERAAAARPPLAALFLKRTIVSAALAEGSAFFAIIAAMIEGQWVALAVASVMIALVIWQFPSQVSAERWLDEQNQRMADESRG